MSQIPFSVDIRVGPVDGQFYACHVAVDLELFYDARTPIEHAAINQELVNLRAEMMDKRNAFIGIVCKQVDNSIREFLTKNDTYNGQPLTLPDCAAGH